VVHAIPSSQVMAVPVQTPPEQWSVDVHIFLSLHRFESSGVKTHPIAGLQLSSVQGLLSLQILGVLPTHTPRLHTSDVVQGLASSHEAELLA
jgi:hypothetical protein